MTDSSSIAPIALLVFNRPHLLARVIDQIRRVQPPLILVVADGPRPNVPADVQLCAEVRALVRDRIDWGAKVLTHYSEINLGLRKRVSTGLDWVFQNVEEAIMFEDDCLPDPTFFRFCTDLLGHYRHDTRIGAIAGTNFQPQNPSCAESYYFSKYPHCWGWATWRRAWKLFDSDLTEWPRLRDQRWLNGLFADELQARFWEQLFEGVHEGKINSWAYAWTFSCWAQSMMTILPQSNLVTNVGFGEAATHTTASGSRFELKATPISFPLSHPKTVAIDAAADDFTQHTVFGSAEPRSVMERLRRWINRRVT